jgi:hypothetical protein
MLIILLFLCFCELPKLLALTTGIETRRSTLFPWKGEKADNKPRPLGWINEIVDHSQRNFHVDIFWHATKNNPMSIQVPYTDTDDSLADSIWPSSLASAILCQSPKLSAFLHNRSILELGCGLGLAGLASSTAKPTSCLLTDSSEDCIAALQTMIARNDEKGATFDSTNVRAQVLEWRNEHVAQETTQVILGADVAYYYYLLRPLMDTAQAYRDKESVCLFVGQANRESQWDLYRNINHGCYNQRTDNHDGPWEGTTKSLLYKLQMETWATGDPGTERGQVDGVIPIAVLIHQSPGLCVGPLTDFDYEATNEDIGAMLISF